MTVGPPSPLATPPITSAAVSVTTECAATATATHDAVVSAAASRMPRTGPIRSSSRPAGFELTADTT